jgi:hypothetical protein
MNSRNKLLHLYRGKGKIAATSSCDQRVKKKKEKKQLRQDGVSFDSVASRFDKEKKEKRKV